jgi:hypothetical protein
MHTMDLHADTTLISLSGCSEPFHMRCQFHLLSVQSSNTIWCHYYANLGYIFISCTNHTWLILKSFISVHHVANTIFHCLLNLSAKEMHLCQLLKQTVWQAVVTHFSSMSDSSTLTCHSLFQLASQIVQSTLANFTHNTLTGNAINLNTTECRKLLDLPLCMFLTIAIVKHTVQTYLTFLKNVHVPWDRHKTTTSLIYQLL